MTADFEELVGANLGDPRPTNASEAVLVAQQHLADLHGLIEGEFGRAGFYGRDATPYPSPTVPVDAPRPGRSPKVEGARNVWVGRWDPSDERFFDGVRHWSDIADPGLFPWEHPEAALSDGWWVSTDRWPDSTLHGRVGDLVIIQRKRPDKNQRTSDLLDSDSMYVGLAAVLAVTSWLDDVTGRFDSQACLIPLCSFDHPVPLGIAKRIKQRLKHPAFSRLPATPDMSGMNRQLSAVPQDAVVDLLSVCGVSPEVLAEDTLATIAARLRATSTGNKEYLDLRYDHQVAHSARRANEMRAEGAARAWAKHQGYTFVSRDALTPLLGYDLLFRDDADDELQVEVKGYSSDKLNVVHLQPSQVRRAEEAAAGKPPDWRLYVLLRASTQHPKEVVLYPDKVVELVRSGGLAVSAYGPGFPAP